MTIRYGQLASVLMCWLGSTLAHAQSAASCSFDAGTRTLTVSVDGIPAILSVGAAGPIKLNNVKCGAATTTTTDLVQIDGSALSDKVTVTNANAFAPGATAEPTGSSEIEIRVSLNEGVDTAILSYTDDPESIRFGTTGIDVFGDSDTDLTLTNGEDVEVVKVKTKGGADTINAAAYNAFGKLYLYGGQGNDSIVAAIAVTSRLYGEDGDDELFGRGTSFLYGGPGNDICHGANGLGSGYTFFVADATYDGDDEYYGGSGRDTIDYSKRTNGVSVTPDDDLANDGEPGEADFVDEDVENLTGGDGDDVLIGTSERNTLTGNAGDDSLYGGPDVDKFYGGEGDDVIFNDDGVNNETVDCGPGIDDPQPSNDNFTACELI